MHAFSVYDSIVKNSENFAGFLLHAAPSRGILYLTDGGSNTGLFWGFPMGRKLRSWGMYSGQSHHVAVIERHDGQWIASMGLKPILDAAGTSVKQEVFPDVESALRWVGYPVDFVPIPQELN